MIKKNGGIFGRNPTFNDVVVEGQLTLGGDQTFDGNLTIEGDLTVNGTETVINTVELNVDDKNITMGAVTAKVGLVATTNITSGAFTVQLASTVGLIPGMVVTKTSGTGAFGAGAKIASVDSAKQITLTVAHATSGTITFDVGGATDDTADGGGITLKGTTDKLITWVKSKLAWVFSDKIEAPDVVVTNLSPSLTVFTDANKTLVTKTQQDALNAIAGAVTSARFLRGDGTNVTLSAIQASDVPTLNQNTTGTAAGLSSTLAISSGGTGQTTQQAAINALAGAVTSAKFLRGDGTNVTMSSIQASDVPTLNQNTTGTAAGLSATLAIASGGTNATSFTGKSGNVAGLVFFDGTKLANDATVTDVGYDTSTHTLQANNFQTSNLFNGPHHWGNMYNTATGTTTRVYDTGIGHITDTLGWYSANTRDNQAFSGKAAIYELTYAGDPNAVNSYYSQAQNGFVYIWADYDGTGVAWKILYYKVYEAPHALGSSVTVSAVFWNSVTSSESNYVPIYGSTQSNYKIRLKAVHATDPGVSGTFYLKRIL